MSNWLLIGILVVDLIWGAALIGAMILPADGDRP